MSSLRTAKPMTCPPLPAESKRQWTEGHPKADSAQPNSPLPLIITRRNASTPSNLNFLFSTLRHTKRTPSIKRRPHDSSYAFISFCKSQSSLSVRTFPFSFLLLFYNFKSIPKSPKASGQPSNLRKKQSTSLAYPSPFRRWVAGRKGGHKQPAASRNLTAHSGPLNTFRLTSDKSLPFPPFRGKPRNLPRTVSPP